MATSVSERIARAVASDLTAAASEFAMSFVAKYEPMPEHTLSELRILRMDVRDTGQRSLGRGTRGRTDYEYEVQIVTQVQLNDSLSAVLSNLKLFAEQVADYFMFESPTGIEETIDRVDVAQFDTDEDLKKLGLGRFSMSLVYTGHRAKRT